MVIEKKDKRVGKDNTKGLYLEDGDQPIIINQIIRELETNDMKGKVCNKIIGA